jgi:hypothetical protein
MTICSNSRVKNAVPQTHSVETLPAVQLMAAVALSELCKPIQRDAEVQTETDEKPKRRQITPSKAQSNFDNLYLRFFYVNLKFYRHRKKN